MKITNKTPKPTSYVFEIAVSPDEYKNLSQALEKAVNMLSVQQDRDCLFLSDLREQIYRAITETY